MDSILPIIIQLIGGAAGGNVVGALLKNANLSAILRTVLGVIGGVGGGQLASLMPALEALMGGGGGGAILGNAGASAVGGGVLALIGGLIKQAMDKSKG